MDWLLLSDPVLNPSRALSALRARKQARCLCLRQGFQCCYWVDKKLLQRSFHDRLKLGY